MLSVRATIKTSAARISRFILYGWKTWSLRVTEEHRLTALREMFGQRNKKKKADDETTKNVMGFSARQKRLRRSVTHKWGKLSYIYKTATSVRFLVGKPEGNTPLRRHSCRLKDNIKIHTDDIGWTGFVSLGTGTIFFGSCECASEFFGSIKCGEILD